MSRDFGFEVLELVLLLPVLLLVLAVLVAPLVTLMVVVVLAAATVVVILAVAAAVIIDSCLYRKLPLSASLPEAKNLSASTAVINISEDFSFLGQAQWCLSSCVKSPKPVK